MIVSDVGTNHERLVQLLAASVGDHRRLRRKSLHVLRLLVQEALRDQQRKVRVLVSRFLEHVVELALHPLPDPIPIGANHHATAHWRIIRQLGAHYELVVPCAEILRASWEASFLQPSMESIGERTGSVM